MNYITKKDVLNRISAKNLEVVTEGDDSLLEGDNELDAISEVSSYLDHDYDVDEVFKPVDTIGYSMHPTIKRMVVDVMLYNLHNGKVSPRNIPKNVVERRDDAIKWLKSVADPKTMVNARFLPKRTFEEKSNNAGAWGSKPKRSHRY